jgi:1,4-alpha-glucan branching enzyme
VLSFMRHGVDAGALVVVVCNFTPAVRHHYRVGVPHAGVYAERINTDSAYYGGSNVGSPFGEVTAQGSASHGQAFSLELVLPPLATVIFEWKG